MPQLKKGARISRQEKLVAALRQGHDWTAACRAAGVSYRTIHRWADADPEFLAAIDEARDAALADIECAAFDAARNPNPGNNSMRMFLLKCRAPETWNDKINDQPNIVVAPGITPEAVADLFAHSRQPHDARPDPAHSNGH